MTTLQPPAALDDDVVAARLRQIWSDPPGIAGFLSTVDHKRIGRRYLVTALVFMALGGVQALVMRTQLATPENALVSADVYNRLMTIHGTTMIFLFNTTIWSGFGNSVLPLQIGTRDMAFPRANALSYWIFLCSGAFLYFSFFIGQVPDGGWFAYVPLTTEQFSPERAMDFWAIGLAFLGLSSTIGAVNFLVTTFKLRAPGMTISRLPIFVWGIVVMAVMILFAFPAVTLAQVLLELNRSLGLAFFDVGAGGDPLLYQHLFWFWGHPEVYIVFVPATAVVSTVVSVFSQRRLVGHLLVVAALVAIGFISFGVWSHHMFATGLGFLSLSFFAAASFVVSIPSGVQFFAWIATLWEGQPRLQVPLLWSLGMMFTFLLGGITGVMVAMVPFDLQATDSYFVVAHFHYTLVGGSVFPIFAGLYHWWPKVTGHMPPVRASRIAFWMVFIGFQVTFFPQHLLGLWGMPRRTYTYLDGLGWETLNLVSTGGSYLLGAGFLLAMVTLAMSWNRGPVAPANPWNADTLEWAMPSPAPPYGFLRFPRVSSRHPLWDVDADGEVTVRTIPDGDGPVLVPPEGVEEHWVVESSGLDAEADTALAMPGPSPWPFALALSLTVVAVGTLVRALPVFIAGMVLVTFSLMAWFGPRQDEPVELAGEPDDPREAVR